MLDIISSIGVKIGWDVLRQALGTSTILTFILYMIARYAFEQLPTRTQKIVFGVGTFVLIAFLFILISGPLSPRPHLSVGIDRLHVTNQPINLQMPALPKDEIGIVVVAGVSNAGMPSMANCCQLLVRPVGGIDIIADRLQVPKTLNLQDPGSGTILVSYSGADALYDKLSTKPIETGEMVRGVLLFGLHGVSYNNLTSPGTKYEIELTDVMGARVDGEYQWQTTATDQAMYLPGLSNSNQCPALPRAKMRTNDPYSSSRPESHMASMADNLT